MNTIEVGDCSEVMKRWVTEGVEVRTCVTSPPYFGLRDYGVEGQIGLEDTPEAYITRLVEVFRIVRDLLTDDGTLWLNLGDSYSHGGCGARDPERWPKQSRNDHNITHAKKNTGLKEKDLIGIPWRVAFALQADGWYLRQDIIWHKPNPMPESVVDRCTKAHEYVFLLSKSRRYYFDAEAIKEPAVSKGEALKTPDGWDTSNRSHGTIHREGRESGKRNGDTQSLTRNRRSVWTITTKPFKGSHFATFPPDLVEPCILAGSQPNDIVLDPFIGSGTVAGVAQKHDRQYLGCELNPAYVELSEQRISNIVSK